MDPLEKSRPEPAEFSWGSTEDSLLTAAPSIIPTLFEPHPVAQAAQQNDEPCFRRHLFVSALITPAMELEHTQIESCIRGDEGTACWMDSNSSARVLLLSLRTNRRTCTQRPSGIRCFIVHGKDQHGKPRPPRMDALR